MTPNEFIHALMDAAIAERASDIHIEPLSREIRIRFRIDGRLLEKETRPFHELEPVLNRIKVMANLDITTHNIPQDGHLEVEIPDIKLGQHDDPNFDTHDQRKRILDVRISIFPTVNGETAVMRLLNRAEMLIPLHELGFDPKSMQTMRKLITKSYGMLLITGPAGSGKTTTLYSILREIRSKEKNIMTLEDPVEYYLDDIRQSNVNPAGQGLTFESGMRSVLRQDPDIVMIGEIRDKDTAEYAIRAALTGRIMFSTVHSNTAIGTVARLIDMQIERSLIAYALNGVVAQRLVGKVCDSCKKEYTPDPALLHFLGMDDVKARFVKGAGCDICHGSGFRGRIGLFEVLEFDNNIRSLIVEGVPMNKLQEYIDQMGFKTIRQDATEKIIAGFTTVEEAVKVA